jgi:hypothetical protein
VGIATWKALQPDLRAILFNTIALLNALTTPRNVLKRHFKIKFSMLNNLIFNLYMKHISLMLEIRTSVIRGPGLQPPRHHDSSFGNN